MEPHRRGKTQKYTMAKKHLVAQYTCRQPLKCMPTGLPRCFLCQEYISSQSWSCKTKKIEKRRVKFQGCSDGKPITRTPTVFIFCGDLKEKAEDLLVKQGTWYCSFSSIRGLRGEMKINKHSGAPEIQWTNGMKLGWDYKWFKSPSTQQFIHFA